ncbi:MAG: hypothetical protein JW958_04870 [Candidatus Eisenbacteria bacterium]|nr:hypothetical protein [Candidatus Eisenbacteria bacterium]
MNGVTLALQRGNIPLLLAAFLFALLAAVWAYRRTIPPVSAPVRRLLGALRFASTALLLALLFDPLLTVSREETLRPAVAVLLDRSASMGIVDGEGGPRRLAADRALREEPAAVLEKLERRYEVVRYGFSGALHPWEEEGEGDATDLSRAVEEAVEAEWERGLDGIVLLSDGAVNAGRDPVRVAEEAGVPIFPIPIGDPEAVRDLSIRQALANRLVYANSRVAAEVTIRAQGFAGESVPVSIREGDREVARDTVRFEGRRETRTLTFRFPVTEEGIRRFRVEAPVSEGERVGENNHLDFTIEVVKERLRVLLFADRPGWDFAFLRRTLEKDANLSVYAFFQGLGGGPAPADPGAPGNEPFPATEEELRRFDLVFLFGVPDAVRREWGEALDRFVRVRGGGLVFLAVDPLRRGVPEPLASLLPVAASPGDLYQEGGFKPRITTEGVRHPILRIEPEDAENVARWEELPPLLGMNRLGPVRPGATPLAVHPGLDVEGRPAPLLVLGPAGKGRVLVVNGAGFWRWDFRMWGLGKSNRTYERLWSNALRWMVARGGFQNVTVRPEEMTVRRSETIDLRGLVLDESLSPVPDARLEVTVHSDMGEPERFFLEPDPAEPGAYHRSIGPLPPGEYAYEAAAQKGGALLGKDEGAFSVSDFSPEFLDTERNDELLAAIARASGGRVLPVEELAEWGGDLSLPSRTRIARSEREIWNHPAVLILLVLLFGAEWFIRKRKGLS